MPIWGVVVTMLGSLALVGVVLVIVFAAVKRAIDRAAEALADEGIERDSGPITITSRMKGFRSPTIYSSSAYRRNPGRVVLTARRLHILQRPQRYGIIERADLSRFTVTIGKRGLVLRSDDPPGAQGSIEYTMPVAEPTAWVDALVAAGAQPGGSPRLAS